MERTDTHLVPKKIVFKSYRKIMCPICVGNMKCSGTYAYVRSVVLKLERASELPEGFVEILQVLSGTPIVSD